MAVAMSSCRDTVPPSGPSSLQGMISCMLGGACVACWSPLLMCDCSSNRGFVLRYRCRHTVHIALWHANGQGCKMYEQFCLTAAAGGEAAAGFVQIASRICTLGTKDSNSSSWETSAAFVAHIWLQWHVPCTAPPQSTLRHASLLGKTVNTLPPPPFT